MVKVTHFTSPRIKISTSFSRLVAGSPELCACEHLQASTLWPKHVKASFFFWPHIYLLFDFVASSKAIFIPFFNTRRKSSPLLALISLCKMQDFFSSPHWDTTSSSKHPVIVIFNHKLSSTNTPIQKKKNFPLLVTFPKKTAWRTFDLWRSWMAKAIHTQADFLLNDV